MGAVCYYIQPTTTTPFCSSSLLYIYSFHYISLFNIHKMYIFLNSFVIPYIISTLSDYTIVPILHISTKYLHSTYTILIFAIILYIFFLPFYLYTLYYLG